MMVGVPGEADETGVRTAELELLAALAALSAIHTMPPTSLYSEYQGGEHDGTVCT